MELGRKGYDVCSRYSIWLKTIRVLCAAMLCTACQGGPATQNAAAGTLPPRPAGPHSTSGTAQHATPAGIEMPVALRGVWRMGEAPCTVPHPDSDGVLTITPRGWQGYEYSVTLHSVTRDPASANRWRIAGEESYLGSQRDLVEPVFDLSGRRLTLREGDAMEVYSRCVGEH